MAKIILLKDGNLSVDGNAVIQEGLTANTISANTITSDLIGNANTASKLKSPKTIKITGDATGSTVFDGSTDVSIDTTLIGDYATNSRVNDVEASIPSITNLATKTELSTGLNSKANAVHTHTIVQVDGLEDDLNARTLFYSVTYQELKDLVISKNLQIGASYGINDYTCIYKMPIINIEMEQPADDIKYIVIKAIDKDELSEDADIVHSETYTGLPIIECKYDFNPENTRWTSGMITLKPKGVIYYMKDSWGNECSYDFKHIKFRRWAIKDITANDTESNGTTFGCFRTYVTSTATPLYDTRAWVGSGHPSEKEFISDIFNGSYRGKGNWVTNSGTGTSCLPFHQDYITYILKPWTKTADKENYDKYIACSPDMQGANGVSKPNSVWKNANGMARFDVDENDYIDRYTFDYCGEDASNMTKPSSTPCVGGAKILQTLYGYKHKISNTVITLSHTTINHANSFIQGLSLQGYIMDNTILLRGEPNSFSQISRFVVNDKGRFANNLFIGKAFNMVNFGLETSNNYINGYLSNIKIASLSYNVMFGYFKGLNAFELNCDLFYASESSVKLEGDTSWHNDADGSYTYNTTMKDWFGYNIVGPLQYATFEPHFNCNTFRAPYNKEIIFKGNTQYNSFGCVKWGIEVGYGSCNGAYFNEITRTKISSNAFATTSYTEGPATKVSPTTIFPSMNYTDANFVFGNSTEMLANLSENQRVKLNDFNTLHGRKIWTTNGTTTGSTVAYMDEVIMGISPINVLSLEEDNSERSILEIEKMREMMDKDFPPPTMDEISFGFE